MATDIMATSTTKLTYSRPFRLARLVRSAQEAEKKKLVAEQKLKEEIESAAVAEKQAQISTQNKLNAIARNEEEKQNLVNIVGEANAIVQKRVWAERKLRTEADKATEAQTKIDLEMKKREAAELRRETEIKLALKAEEEAELEVQKRINLVKTTEEEKGLIKKALKDAEAHRVVKKKAEAKLEAEVRALKSAENSVLEKEKERKEAEEKMRSTKLATKKAQEDLAKQKLELEQLKSNALKMKEEARVALDEAKEAQEIQQQATKLSNMQTSNQDQRTLTRKATSSVIEKLETQLKMQRELQKGKVSERALMKTRILAMNPAKWLQTAISTTKLTNSILLTRFTCFALASLKMRLSSLRSAQNDDDKALAQMQIQQQRLEMVKKEKAALKEHAEALAELEKETEMLKQKRIQIEEKRATENKALADLVNEQHKQADEGNAKMGGEVRMMKSSGSLYNLLESKKKGAGGEGETSIGVIEEEEDDLEESMADGGGLISSSFKLASPNVCMSCRKKRGDLPVPHFAAASGHVDCLTHIVNTDPSSIATFDKAQRSPLFYACANNQTLTAVLLIEGAKQSRKWDVGGYKPRTNNIHNAQSRHKRRNYATTTATRHCTRAQAREAPS